MDVVYSGFLALHAVVAIYYVVSVLRSRSEPAAMVAWILIVLFLPLLGSALYALLGESRLAARAERKRRRRLGVDDNFAKWFAEQVADDAECPREELIQPLRRVAVTAQVLADCPVTAGNTVEVLDDPEAFHQRLLREIKSAREHLHLLYYIWAPDDTGREMLNAVMEQARSGVVCRVLLDAAGSVQMPRDLLEEAEAAGVTIAFFMPLRPTRRRYSVHLRNHRKIAVIDGRRALVGSQNISEEERGRGDLQPFHQVSVALTGPVVRYLQRVFAGDWNAYGGEILDVPSLFPAPDCPGAAPLQVVATGPDQPYHVMERILMEALAGAEEEVWIATPYFVPSESVRLALGQASIRGVAVHLVVPEKNDRAVALWAGRSFYGGLITEGVEIHEYGKGMIHSKVVAIDGRWAMVGTVNMDFRSFRLNFEVSVLGYDEELARKVADIVRAYVADAKEVSAEAVSNRSYGQQLLAGACRLLASQL